MLALQSQVCVVLGSSSALDVCGDSGGLAAWTLSLHLGQLIRLN